MIAKKKKEGDTVQRIKTTIVSKIVKHINYVIVFVIGLLLGIYISYLANSTNSDRDVYTGCILLCTYAPTYNGVQPLHPIKPYTRIHFLDLHITDTAGCLLWCTYAPIYLPIYQPLP